MKGYNELFDWQIKKKHKIFGTLTMKRIATYNDLTKANKHFFNCVNRHLFGNYKRKGNRLDTFSTIQQMANGDWHIHFTTEMAENYTADDFIKLLTNIWRNKVNGSGISLINKIRDKKKAIGYLLHDYYKLGNDTLAI